MPFKTRMNSHQTHMEDLVLLGKDGLEELNDKIEKFLTTLEGNDVGLNTTTKIDGAPAVICWSKSRRHYIKIMVKYDGEFCKHP